MAWFPCQQWLQSHRRGWSALDVLCPACGICAKRGCTVSRAVNVSLVGVPVDCLVARVDRSRKLPWACRGPGCSCLRCGVVEDLQGPCSFVRSLLSVRENVGSSLPCEGRAVWGTWCPGPTTVTWLILPVVICLSQRLSHACLSINASIL